MHLSRASLLGGRCVRSAGPLITLFFLPPASRRACHYPLSPCYPHTHPALPLFLHASRLRERLLREVARERVTGRLRVNEKFKLRRCESWPPAGRSVFLRLGLSSSPLLLRPSPSILFKHCTSAPELSRRSFAGCRADQCPSSPSGLALGSPSPSHNGCECRLSPGPSGRPTLSCRPC